MSELFNHWTGEWFYPGFVYKIQAGDCCNDFDSWDEPTYKVGMHVRWHCSAGSLREQAVDGTGIILGLERCVDQEPGFWFYKMQHLTGHKYPEDYQLAEHEIVEVLRPLAGEELAQAMDWTDAMEKVA